MQIKLVSLEDGITSCGFRKMAAFVARINEDTESCYVSTNRYRSIRNGLRGTLGSAGSLEPEDIDLAARDLIKSDLVGFSSMTGYSDLTRKLIQRVKELDPSTYVIWGGIHPIIHPEDAILSDVDAICTGEGEFAFQQLYDELMAGRRPTNIKNFWFKAGRRRGHPQPLPPAHVAGRDGVAAVPAVRRGRAHLPGGRRLHPDEGVRLHRQRRPELHDAVVDRLPVSLLVLRQHEVHLQRPEVQAHPPPERALHRRRDQDRAVALPAPQPGLVPRRQLHGDPVPPDRGVRGAVEGRARPPVRRLRRDPELRQPRQVRAADVGRHEPRADGHPERQPQHARVLQAPLAAREDPRGRVGQRVVLAGLPHPPGLRHHHRQPDRDGPGPQGHAAAALRHGAAVHAVHLLAEGHPEHRAREGDEGARRRHRGDLGDVHVDPAARLQPPAVLALHLAPAVLAVEAPA